ncbi:MAG: cysteine-rich small domain-containing protein [Desulfovibrionaceae bacterium]|nr:cysteine-rich small domain-containing protein [Desulfovibrionaceae bacterium]
MGEHTVKEGHFSFFSNRECEYFPCHPNADPDNFNCLFCYCPLYLLGRGCGGNFQYMANGIKDCTNCLFPHKRENYRAVTRRYADILALLQKQELEERERKGGADNRGGASGGDAPEGSRE